MRAELQTALFGLTLLVTACSTAPGSAPAAAPVVSRLDGPTIQRSLARMRAALPETRRVAFDVAVREVSIARCPRVRQALCNGSNPRAIDSRCLGQHIGGKTAAEIFALADIIDPTAACAELAGAVPVQ